MSNLFIIIFVKNKRLKNKIFKLNDNILMNLKFWLLAIPTIQSSPISGLFKFWKIQHSIFTDASNFAIGIFDGSNFGARSVMGTKFESLPIHEKEALAVASALLTLNKKYTGTAVMIHVDNLLVYYAMKRKWAKAQSLMRWVFLIALICIQFKIYPVIRWIPTESNVFADALSRNDEMKFFNLCQYFFL